MALTCVASNSAVGPTCDAAQHFWDIQEIYSNHDGSVQFIEFFTTQPSQEFLNFHSITATSTVAGTPTVKTFNFTADLPVVFPNTTAGKTMLIATPGFGALAGGVTPDYPLTFTPAGGPFFNPNADSITIDFGTGFDILTFAGSLLPKDGVNALRDHVPAGTPHLVSEPNTPKNFAGATGSVNLPPPSGNPADFNGDTMVNGADLALWRSGFGATGAPTAMQGNADADGDVDGHDFLIWQRAVNAPGVSAIPEPGTAILAILAACAVLAHCRHRGV